MNLERVLLFYIEKYFTQLGVNMDITTLQSEITAFNNLLDAMTKLFPSTGANTLVQFIKQADNNPLLLNIILLVVNLGNATPAVSTEVKQ